MPWLLPEFRRRHPSIELELRGSTHLELPSPLEQKKRDAGLVRYPSANASALNFQAVERDVFHAVLTKGHKLAALRTVTLKALAQDPLEKDILAPLGDRPVRTITHTGLRDALCKLGRSRKRGRTAERMLAELRSFDR